jgi:hypothetical protein
MSTEKTEKLARVERQREAIEWSITYWFNATDTQLPRILLVGDSICNGYHGQVREELDGTAYTSFWASSRCVTDRSYIKELTHLLDEYAYAVIHFNNGLHSLDTDRATWAAALDDVIAVLKAKGRGAKLVWASSTPLTDPALTAKAQELNAIAARVMAKHGIPTNDLFALVAPMGKEQWCDVYHYHEPAKRLQAKQVAAAVRAQLA